MVISCFFWLLLLLFFFFTATKKGKCDFADKGAYLLTFLALIGAKEQFLRLQGSELFCPSD